MKRRSTRGKRLSLEPLEVRQLLAVDVVMFNDVSVGPDTHANATSYVASGTASGLLRDVSTGDPTGITLATSHVGAAFRTGGGAAQGETDAATIFNGFVDFTSGTDSAIEIADDDSYTYSLSGLNEANRYDLVATAMRGNPVYFNRWTLVSIEGAVSFTASHSEGNGITTEGLADNQVAVLTGSNNRSTQGFVAQWLDIDPGPDGEIEIVSQHYTGPAPGSSRGTPGYAVTGLRLVERDFNTATVSNVPVTSSFATAAEIGATVDDTGGSDPMVTLYWGGTDGGTNPADWNSFVTLGEVGEGTYTETITGLNSETEYFFRTFAQNDAGDSWASSSASFTTGTLSLPALVTHPVTDIGAFSATVAGLVTDAGGEPPIVTIYYGTSDGDTDVNAWENLLVIGEALDEFSAGIPGLSPESEYFFRARATNSAGSTWSPVTRNFLTGDTPLVAISEFMAQNNSTLTTRTRSSVDVAFSGPTDTPDWIELTSLSGSEVNVSGMHLTDNAGDPNQWQFPAGATIPADGYLVVFASGEDIIDSALDEQGYLHTNFSLGAGGEYLALTTVDGTVVHEFTSPPNQVADISYGLAGDDPRYFSTPTPGATNSSKFTDLVADTQFSVDRGFYEEAFEVEITTATEGATIRYTLDGSTPSASHGTEYGEPISVTGTTTLRALAFKPGLRPTNVDTHTYVFVDDVVTQSFQSTVDAGFPNSWSGTGPDYGMDPDVIGPNDRFDGVYAETIRDDLKALPTLSIVTEVDDIFGSSGIYANPSNRSLEVPTSIEFFDDDGTEEFQINAGIKIQGGAFRSWGLTKKKSFRLKFKSEYGPAKLKYPVFGDDATNEFDTLTLRMEANDGWQWNGAGSQPQYARDEFLRRVQLAMGEPASHGRNVHVYINGVYWGMYNMVERADQSFGEAYYGADKEDWDGINTNGPINAADDADRRSRANAAWNTLLQMSRDVANAGTEAEKTAAYMKVQGLNPDGSNNPNWETYLDADNMVDYFLVNWYADNSDWPRKNYYFGRENSPDSEGFQFFTWDAEWSLFMRSSVTGNNISDGAGVGAPVQSLRASEEFRMLFGDHVQRHLVNPGGALYVDPDHSEWDPDHPERNIPAALYAQVAEENYEGLVAESARWGDQHRGTPYTRNIEWQNEYDRIMNTWFPDRTANFLNHLIAADLYPEIGSPVFEINGERQHGGSIHGGDTLSMTAAAATVTTDTTLVAIDSAATAFVPTDDSLETGAGPHWYDVEFADAGWMTGTNGVGYDNGNDYHDLIGTDVADAWNAANPTSVYSRFEFDLDADFDASVIDRLELKMKYDDGYAVYLNGQFVHGTNTPSPIEWNSRATGKRLNLLNTIASVVETTDLSDSISLLQPGRNVLAIHVLNHATDMGDLLARPELILSDDVQLSAPIMYTLDGSDPRELGGAAVGVSYDGSIPLTETTVVNARAFVNGEWSARNQATFVVNPAEQGDIVISEINYNPASPTTTELAAIGTLDNDDFEFIEVFNRGDTAVDLLGAEFTSGVDFEFPAHELAPGQRVVVVRDTAAFELRYGTDLPVIGEFADGSLNNGGEQIGIADRDGNLLVEFEYDDTRLWPQSADGVGATLELIAPETTPSDQLGKPYRWQGSADVGGSPGTVGNPVAGIVISEVLAHTESPPGAVDVIELHNPTAAAVDIGGWFLSDSAGNLRKFEIPANTVLEPSGYAVFDEHDFNPTPLDPGENDFALSGVRGDSVWLTTGANRFVDDVHFDASLDGVSFVASPSGIGVVSSARPTLGCDNRSPRLPSVVVSEVNYNPGEPSAAALAVYDGLAEDDLEFVEIHNPTFESIDLTNWRLRGGVDMDFEPATVLAPNASIVVISFNPLSAENADRVEAFRTHYGISEDVPLVGGFGGQLSDSGESVRLQMPDTAPADEPDLIPRVVTDEVAYDDGAPWPNADGSGQSIQRIGTTFFGSDGDSWDGRVPTPGAVSFVGDRGDLNGDGAVDVADLTTLADAISVGNTQTVLDIDANGTVEQADVEAFLRDVLGSVPGDANLDGVVDGSDFNLWNDHKFQSCNVTFADGDFNTDGMVDGSDFNLWTSNRFTSVVAPAVEAARAQTPRATASLDSLFAEGHEDGARQYDAGPMERAHRRERLRKASLERRRVGNDETTAADADRVLRDVSDWLKVRRERLGRHADRPVR